MICLHLILNLQPICKSYLLLGIPLGLRRKIHSYLYSVVQGLCKRIDLPAGNDKAAASGFAIDSWQNVDSPLESIDRDCLVLEGVLCCRCGEEEYDSCDENDRNVSSFEDGHSEIGLKIGSIDYR